MTTPTCSRLLVSSRLLPVAIKTLLLLAVFPAFTVRLCAQDASHSPGWVVISVPDYHALRVKAYPAEREPEPPPVDAALTRVEYDLRVDSDLASGRATLTVDVLKNGWVRVPLPAGLFVREAKLDGKALSLAPRPAAKTPITYRPCSLIPAARLSRSRSPCPSPPRPARNAFRFLPPSPASPK